MKARITWIIVCLLAIAQGAWAQDEPLIVKTLDALQTAVQTNNANIKLGADITLTSEVVIEGNRIITIDLNGCKLDRGLKETSATNGHVLKITSGSTLTINDSSSKGEGCITGGYAAHGGGIYNEGTLNISGNVTISKNKAHNGGGICNYGTLNISGGNIKENEATESFGGGISNYGTLKVSGGTITGNLAYYDEGGGIYNVENATLYMEGTPVVSGNYKTTDDENTPNNVYLRSGQVIYVSNPFREGAHIGITTETTPMVVTNGFGSYSSGNDPSAFFFSDLGLFVSKVENGDGILGNTNIEGMGTEDSPYLITNTDQWNLIAYLVEEGNSFEDKHLKLNTENLTVTTMIGTSKGDDVYPFSGTFDGGGNTLTLAFGSESEYINQTCAPFRFIKGATIQNLVIAGSIYSSAKFNGSLVGSAIGKEGGDGEKNYIKNCISRASINSSISGECSNGGFLGQIETEGVVPVSVTEESGGPRVYFEGCAFTGQLIGAQATNWGGFVGWRIYSQPFLTTYYTYVSFKDCLFAPTNVNIATTDDSNSRTFCRSTGNTTRGASYDNCYYKTMLQAADGGKISNISTTQPPNIGTEVKTYAVSDITVYTNGIKCGERYYFDCIDLADNAANTDFISDLATTYSGQSLYMRILGRTLYEDNNWNTICLPFDVERSYLNDADVRTLSSATLTNGTLTLNFSEEPVNKLIAGTPYIIKWNPIHYINSTADWNDFASKVSNGKNYDGETVVLKDDIEVSTMVGTMVNPFNGTFDGNGHTLTFNIDSYEDYCAPFGCIENGSIVNLHIAGTIKSDKTNAYHASGFALNSKGTVNITNCRSSVIFGTREFGTYSGFVQSSEGITTFTDCLFDGSFDGSYLYVSGFLAANSNDKYINCLSKNAEGCYPFRASANNVSNIDNCFCSNQNSTEQGTLIGETTNEALVAVLGDNWQLKDGEAIPVVMEIDKNGEITNPVFNGVTITATAPTDITPGTTAGTIGDRSITFKGTYDPVEIGSTGDDTKLFLGTDNKLYYPNAAMTIGAFRAYFQLNHPGPGIRAIVLNFGDDANQTNSIVEVEANTSLSTLHPSLSGWFTLDGRKISVKPTAKGMYINGNKMTIIN